MTQFDYKQFTERHRPHIHPPGATLLVTYRLAGSIPRATVRLYKAKKEWLADQLARVERAGHVADEPALAELTRRLVDFNREWFIKYEDILHKATSGPMWMKNERAADAVAKSLHKLNGKAYRLDAFSVMSNHVHAVFQPFLTENGLHETMDQGGKTFWACDHPSLSRI